MTGKERNKERGKIKKKDIEIVIERKKRKGKERNRKMVMKKKRFFKK